MAQPRYRILGQACDVGVFAGVRGNPVGVDALALELRHGGFQLGRLARRQQHTCTGLAEGLRHLQTQPARAAGDQRGLAGQVE